MKLLSVVVPCYQSQAYMKHCVETLLGGGDEIEILIINDGSTDATGDIANALEKEHPHMIRAIHQENGGHGGAVMTGLSHATGQYFKVVDSDDWVDESAFQKVISTIRAFDATNTAVDLVLCNYVYDKAGVRHKRVVRYGNVFPSGTPCTWADSKRFRIGQYMLMHSVVFRTQLLRESGLELPKHTFYVDNLFVYQPMRYVKTIYYLDVDLYHYFIGREDQSVNEKVMIRRIDQQITVNKWMLKLDAVRDCTPRELQKYLCSYMEIVTAVSTVLLFRAGDKGSLEKKRTLWEDIHRTDPWLYEYLTRKTLMGFASKHNSLFWRKLCLLAYKVSQRIFGFN